MAFLKRIRRFFKGKNINKPPEHVQISDAADSETSVQQKPTCNIDIPQFHDSYTGVKIYRVHGAWGEYDDYGGYEETSRDGGLLFNISKIITSN